MIPWLTALHLLLFPAWAQQAKPLTITLTQEEAQLMLNKLSEYPWKDVNPLISKIIGQLNAQMITPMPSQEAKPHE